MASPTASTIRCNDSTEIPVEWVYPDAEDYEWVRDRGHWPQPLTPMEVWLRQHAWPGADRAWDEAGMEPPAIFHRFQLVGPFQYVRMTPYALDRMANMIPGYLAVAGRHGNVLRFWQQYCQPRIQRACDELAGTDASASLRPSAELWAYGFHQTFTSAALLGGANMRLTALLTEHAGDDATLMAYEVTQGGENASQDIDREIWELTAIARRTPIVKRTLEVQGESAALAALRKPPDAAAFVTAFDALVERHGSRSQGWDIALPTWREQPEAPLSLIRAQLASGGVSPDELEARSAARRREATERALAAVPPEKHAEFHAAVTELEGYVHVREGRAYWQMVLTGALRALLLRRGERLVQSGRIDRADDVLVLVPDDFEGDSKTDLRSLVVERRREWERWRQVVPPEVIGTSAEAPAAPEAAPDELRGAPASRGNVTGPARVLHGPEDVARLRPGDVLVCVMTTPAWTPLFSVAAGIITETGGALSHPAITAREYGIPAVVAVPRATTKIRDGQIVTIDGGAGIVSLHP
ncbi:MAG: PEP-utilizing enzyme [Dehalococcoidia bacterium]